MTDAMVASAIKGLNMSAFGFSLGRNTYDNAPTQLSASDFDDFIMQISRTGSKRKGDFYICSSLQIGVHDDPVKYPGLKHWRLKRLALPRQFLALDADYFNSPNDFVAFRQLVGQWNALVGSQAIISLASGQMTLRSTPPPPRNYILGNVVIPRSVAVMAGVGGTAKTTLAIQLSIHGALGLNLVTIQVSKFASLLFLGEETADERDRRFGALSTGLSVFDRAAIEKNVYCHGAAGDDLRLTFMYDGNVQESTLVDQIIELSKQHANQADYPVGLIVLDHARLVMAGDPLSADHVTALLRALTRIAVGSGAAVLLLAHSPKSTYGKEGEADPSEVFGSGAFVDHTRSAFVLHTMREKEAKHFGLSNAERKEHVSLNVVKANYGPSGTSWWFKKVPVQGWQAIKLEPVLLLPKGQMTTLSQLSRKITDLIKANPGRMTERALRDKYAGLNGKLGASESEVKRTLQRLLDEGKVISRSPTDQERKLHRLSHNVKGILDLPEVAG